MCTKAFKRTAAGSLLALAMFGSVSGQAHAAGQELWREQIKLTDTPRITFSQDVMSQRSAPGYLLWKDQSSIGGRNVLVVQTGPSSPTAGRYLLWRVQIKG